MAAILELYGEGEQDGWPVYSNLGEAKLAEAYRKRLLALRLEGYAISGEAELPSS